MARKPRETAGAETQYCVRHIPQELSARFDSKLVEIGKDRSTIIVQLIEEYLATGMTARDKALVEVVSQDPAMPARIRNFLQYHNLPLPELIKQAVTLLLDAAEKQWGVKL